MRTATANFVKVVWLAVAVLFLSWATTEARVVIDRPAFEAWSDRTFDAAFAERRFSGLVVSVVQDGDIVFAKSYGYAEFAKKTPIDPARTQFRIGSVSKTLTATVIAELVDRGAIASLDDPANRYLKRLKLPRAFDKEITLWHLLTHQAGFEDTAFGMANLDQRAVPLAAGTIERAMPKIVRQPGTASVYSNFSTALLGVIIEDITGKTAQAVFAEGIFKPLGMDHSKLSYDTTPSPDLGVPYAFLPNGAAQAVRYVGVHPLIAPAGGVTTTAVDMARFMIAHLEAGQGATPAILSPRMFQEMHGRKTGNHAAVSGFGMKFIISRWNGERIVEHGGGWPGFQTMMMMFPDSRAGVFVSFMGGDPVVGLGEQLLTLVSKTRLTPDPAHPVKRPMTMLDARELVLTHLLGAYHLPAQDSAASIAPFLGHYWRERRSYTTVEAIFQLMTAGTSVLHVEDGGAGTLRINGVGGYRAIKPGVFWKAGGGPTLDGDPNAVDLYAFSVANGRAEALTSGLSVDVWRRTSDIWNPATVVGAMGILLLVSASGVLAACWPARPRGGRWSKWLPLAFLVIIVALPLVLLAGYRDGDGLMYRLLLGQSGRFVALIALANLAAILAVLMAGIAILAWRDGYWGEGKRAVARRVHFSLLAVAALAFIPCLWFVNLLGVHLP